MMYTIFLEVVVCSGYFVLHRMRMSKGSSAFFCFLCADGRGTMMRPFLRHVNRHVSFPVRWYGGGKLTGGVKKVSDGFHTAFTGWSLSAAVRDELLRVFPDTHPLLWEYIHQLTAKHCDIQKIQDAAVSSDRNAEDVLRSAMKNSKTQAPFSLTKWNKKYVNDVDEVADVAALLEKLQQSIAMYEDTNRQVASLTNSDDLTAKAEAEEMLALCSDDVDGIVESLKSREEFITSFLSKKVNDADILGSSSRTWDLEVTGRAGGLEASLFAAELLEVLRAYCRNVHGWRVENSSDEASAQTKVRVIGDEVYRFLQHEIGVHKVQRVPVTDANGKMQTSTAVVTLMPEVDPVSVDVQESDCTFDFVRGGGPGGQGMQSSSNCCVMSHRPSGITVKCHQSRSATANKEIALQMVAQQILAKKVKEQASSLNSAWSEQWSSGERSEKMRTYNYPQNRVTDHRLGRDFPLSGFMEGGAMWKELHDALNNANFRQMADTALRSHLENHFDSG